jgi:aryl-alcohol dehydrogenase-like predicted oxidoreductase
MQYRRFGRTNLRISVLTFGAMRIPFGDLSPQERTRAEENAFLTMKRALEVGVNHFETARGYANSEHLIGMSLPHLPVEREELVIHYQNRAHPYCRRDASLHRRVLPANGH